MHEGKIAQAIINMINQELAVRNLSYPVETISVTAGKMNLIVPESLRFYFNILKKEHSYLSEANLTVNTQPVTVYCNSCNQSYELGELSFFCVNCGKPVSIRSGKDIFIESFVLKDDIPMGASPGV